MGTSVNQRSPNTDNWRLVQEIYEDPNMPIDRALDNLWRAASNLNEANLAAMLARTEIGSLSEIAVSSRSPAEAQGNAMRFVSTTKAGSLAADIAARAVVQCAGREGARELFAQRLFAEATSYLVSRDIPGYVSHSGKFKSISDAKRFTREMAEGAAKAASGVPLPASINSRTWPTYVNTVIREIRRRR